MSRGRERVARSLCPSSRCKPGAIVLGVVMEEGEVGYLREPVRVTPRFTEIVNRGRRPEARFRFAASCARGGCARWTGEGCGVAAAAATMVGRGGEPASCTIKDLCQWRREHGESICRACRFVVTERDLSPPQPRI